MNLDKKNILLILLIIMLLMQIIIILISLLVVNSNVNCKYNQYDLQIKSNFRGHYKDVASQLNGAIISNARSNYIYLSPVNIGPLKDSIYLTGLPHFYTFSSMDVQFTQIQEINQIKVWFYDLDGRVHSFKIIAIDKYNIEKELISAYQKQGLVIINFENLFVLKIKIINLPGGTYNALAIIKIQALFVIQSSLLRI